MTREQKLEEALERVRVYVANGVAGDGGIDECDIEYRADLEAVDAALSAPKAEAEEPCPVCAKPFAAGDTCSTDIELGKCHAECLAGSPTVDLETGEPMNGPIGTFPHVAPKAEVVKVKPLEWARFDTSPEAVIYVAQPVVGYYEAGSFADGTIGGVMPSTPMPDERGRTYVKFEAESIEAAKAAAQADYEARILSAIDTSADCRTALAEDAIERAARWMARDNAISGNRSLEAVEDHVTKYWRRYAREATEILLAAFPSKGEGE